MQSVICICSSICVKPEAAHFDLCSSLSPSSLRLDIPQPVENCSIINRTSTSVELTCEAGFDGGLPQVFILEAFQSAPSGRRGLQFNISSPNPTFSLSGLDADGMFHFKIYAMNRKGRSVPSIMDGIALHYPAMQSGK